MCVKVTQAAMFDIRGTVFSLRLTLQGNNGTKSDASLFLFFWVGGGGGGLLFFLCTYIKRHVFVFH